MATCFYCGVETFRPTVDHVVPRHWGGPNVRWNMVQACSDCNNRKANTSYEYFTGNDLLPAVCRYLSGYATTYQFIMENCPDKWPKLQATEAKMTQVLEKRELQRTEYERRKAARKAKRRLKTKQGYKHVHGYEKGSNGSYDTDPQVIFEKWQRGER